MTMSSEKWGSYWRKGKLVPSKVRNLLLLLKTYRLSQLFLNRRADIQKNMFSLLLRKQKWVLMRTQHIESCTWFAEKNDKFRDVIRTTGFGFAKCAEFIGWTFRYEERKESLDVTVKIKLEENLKEVRTELSCFRSKLGWLLGHTTAFYNKSKTWSS